VIKGCRITAFPLLNRVKSGATEAPHSKALRANFQYLEKVAAVSLPHFQGLELLTREFSNDWKTAAAGRAS